MRADETHTEWRRLRRKPGREGLVRRGIRHEAKRHRDDRISGARGNAGTSSTWGDEGVELVLLQHTVNALRAAQARGEVAAVARPADRVDLLVAGIDGLWLGVVMDAKRYPLARRRRLVAALIRSVTGSENT